MLEVHHLNNSRSQRVLWLLEELGVPYQIKPYQRDATTNLAPESLKQIHPLGKSPVIQDGEQVVIESGAILEYIVRKYGKGRLAPPESSPDGRSPSPAHALRRGLGDAARDAAALLRPPGRGRGAAAPAHRERDRQPLRLARFASSPARTGSWATSLSAPPTSSSRSRSRSRGRLYGLDKFPNLKGFLDRCHARPAYRRALERGGPYAFGS